MEATDGYYTLNNGQKIPTCALGTWQSSPAEVTAAVKAAIDAGYKSIDTATIYGNEAEIGAALKECFDAGKIKREELFLTTKIWNSDHKKEDVKRSAKESLQKLGVEYLDLLLIHWSWAGSADFGAKTIKQEYVPLSETWAAMEELVDEGLVKSIGISNFNVQLILDLISYARIKPAVLQVEVHPYHPQTELINWCASEKILVEAYSPLGMGSVPGFDAPSLPRMIEREEIVEVANRLGKTPAQVLVAWGIARGTRVLPKSVTPSRVVENLEGSKFTLSKEDVEKVNSIADRYAIYDIWKHFGLPIFS